MKADYYQSHFLEYHEQTFAVDPTTFLEPLVKRLKSGAEILDVGCGSGRDLLWLKNRGFKVIGLEKSAGLAGLARQHTGCEVIEADFESFEFSEYQVDAVTLIDALVHVPHEKFAEILSSILQALQHDGTLLLTMKAGKGSREFPDGRIFYLWKRPDLENIFDTLGLIRVHFSRQVSKVRPSDEWLSYVLRISREKMGEY
jgi:SAM-dependent methyltransferase